MPPIAPSQLIPIRWAAEWPLSALRKARGSPVNCLVLASPAVKEFVDEAGRAGFAVATLSNLPVLTIDKSVWPGIRAPGPGKEDAGAGPTGVPWAYSNGWAIRLGARGRGLGVWTTFEPPKDTVLTADSYVLAVADSEAYGAHWLLPSAALEFLKPVSQAIAFFDRHKEWKSYRPVARLGVVSDFSGPNEFASGEALNLLARRHQPYRILAKSGLSQTDLADLKAVLYVDQEPAGADLLRMLLAFAAGGGLLIVPAGWHPPEGPQTPEQHFRYRIYKHGRGRIAIAKEEIADPYLLAADSHILLSHSNDLVRVWNASSTNSYYLASAGGTRAVVQMINYATSSGESISLWVHGSYRQARFLTFDGEAPLKAVASGEGTELHLPTIGVYAAVELEK